MNFRHKTRRLVGGFMILTISVLKLSAENKSIRNIDINRYLIERDNLVAACPDFSDSENAKPIHFLDVEYADLDGDGGEEAIVEAATCAMGTGGCDIVEVLKLLPSGELQKLKITNEGYQAPKESDGMGSTPRLDIKDGKLISWYVINAKSPGKPKRGWTKTLVYKWAGNRFVVNNVTETPPEHPEYYR